MIRKPRNQMAHRLVMQSLEKQPDLLQSMPRKDLNFLREFMQNPEVKNLLQITDDIIVPNADGKFESLAEYVRPKRLIERNCLELLSDVWTDLEAFVMYTNPNDQPEAHELYDLLADDNIRQFLLACDDVANERYETPMDSDDFSVWQDIYIEKWPETKKVNVATPRDVFPTSTKQENKPGSKVRDAAKRLESQLASGGGIGVKPLIKPPVETLRTSISPKAFSSEEETTPIPVSRYGNKLNAYSEKPIEYAEVDHATGPKTSFRRYEESENSFDPTQAMPTSRRTSASSQNGFPVMPNNSNPSSRKNSYDNPENVTTARNRSQIPTSPLANPRSPNGSFLEDKENYDRASSVGPKSQRKYSSDRMSNLTAAEIERILPTPGKPRLVQLRREQFQEPLGFTISMKDPETDLDLFTTSPPVSNDVIIQRIMAGSLADRSGLLYPGDTLVSFNGKEINRLEQALSLIKSSSNVNDVQLVVKAPAKGIMRAHLANKSRSSNKNHKVFIKTYISYDPAQDKLMPAGDVGMAFKCGEILELVNSQDPDWWQVRRLNEPNGKARLIPSLMLEEKRQASKNATKKTKSKKIFFSASEPSQKDALLVRSDLWIYEEVVPWPPCNLPCLVLIGPNGVGKRTLKRFLSQRDPKRFCIPLTDTTDPSLQSSSSEYRLVTPERIQADIKDGQYFDWIQAKNHFFGIKYSSLREIINRGSTVIMDCEISNIHLLRVPEFNPQVIFVCPPNSFEAIKEMYEYGIEKNLTTNYKTDDELRAILRESVEMSERYRHIYNYRLINDNFKMSTDRLAKIIYRHAKEPGWIPTQWAFQMSTPPGANAQRDKVYMPGSSNLSSLGISALPPGKRTSVIAKDPSVISGPNSDVSGQMNPSDNASNLDSQISAFGNRIYEKRKPNINRPFQPTGPALVEIPTPSESIADDSNIESPHGQYYSQKSLENAERITNDLPRSNKNVFNYKSPSEMSSSTIRKRNDDHRDSFDSRGSRNDQGRMIRLPPSTLGKKIQEQDDISSTSSED